MQTTQTKISSTAYIDNGRGEPVVMIHCSSTCAREWQKLSETLNADFRSIAVDQWGCGKSAPWNGQTEFTLASEAGPIVSLMLEFGTPVHLVGHSYGGAVAAKIAREHPDLVLSLTLIEPSSFHLLAANPGDADLLGEITAIAKLVTDAVSSGGYWQGAEQFVDYWSGEGSWTAIPHEIKMRLSQTLGKVVLDFRALLDETAEPEDYADIACPTLLLCGELARAPSRRIVDIFAAMIPGAILHMIPKAGHMSPVTHSEAVNRKIIEHLYRHSDSGLQAEVA